MGIFDALKSIFSSKPGKEKELDRLQAGREKLLEEIKVVEHKYLQHQIDEKTYRTWTEEKQMKLIALEAEVETKKIETKIDKLQMQKLEKISKHRRDKVTELLQKKDLFLRELELAKQKYLKHQITEDSYKKITADLQKQLISLEVDLATIYREEAREIIKDAQEKLAKAEKEEQAKTEEEIAEAIMDEPQSVEEPQKQPLKRGKQMPTEDEEIATELYRQETGQEGPEERLRRVRVSEVKEISEEAPPAKLPRRLRRRMRR